MSQEVEVDKEELLTIYGHTDLKLLIENWNRQGSMNNVSNLKWFYQIKEAS